MKRQISSNDVCGLVVTYGDRFSLLTEAVDSFICNDVNEVYCVFNGCNTKDVRRFIERYANSINLIPIILECNTGSAGGFAIGLETYKKLSFKRFVWILDDDNVAERNALSHLLVYQAELNNKVILCSNRIKFKIFEQFNNGTNIGVLYPIPSSFLGLSVLTIFPTFIRFFKKRIGRVNTTREAEKIHIPQAPWGGMLIPKDAIDDNTIPDKDLYLYGDDTAFSIKVSKNGYRFVMIRASIVNDIDASFHLENSASNRFSKWLLSVPEEKVNYSIRNNSYIDKNLRCDKNILFYVNKFVFLAILFVFSIKHGKVGRFLKLLKHIENGEQGRLGRIK